MSEIDDTPGSRVPTDAADADAIGIPAEHLCDTPQAKAIGRKRLRLLMAWELFCSLHAGHLSAIEGESNRSRAWCWSQADKFLGEADRPVATAAAAAVATPKPTPTPVPDVVHQRWYLTWLRDRDGSCLTVEAPPGMDPRTAADVRRHLHNRGLIAATHKGGAVEATGWALTARGWGSVWVPGEPAGGVRLAEMEDAA